jgi:hypothetical protein
MVSGVMAKMANGKTKRQGKIVPGSQWAQRCFADRNKLCGEVDIDEECVECGGMNRVRVKFELPNCCGYWGWRRWVRLGLVEGGQLVATALAVGGVLLNNARIRWCFPVWFVSNVICLVYHLRARLWGMAVRDVIFIGLAIAGWFQWGSG